MNEQTVKPVVLRLILDPIPRSEMIEEIEDLLASTLARHGYAGHIESSATGNSTAVKFRAQVDDGRGYPRQNAPGVIIGELSHALRRVLAYLAIHDSQYHDTNADALRARELLECLKPTAARAGEREFTFTYRDGEMTAIVRAKSEDDAWTKLYRVIHGSADDRAVMVRADASQTHPDLWKDADAPETDNRDGDDDLDTAGNGPELDDFIDEHSDDWTGCANADAVEI